MIIFTNGRFGRMYEAILKQRNENGWSDDMLPDLEKIIGGKHMSESDFTRFKLFYSDEVAKAQKGESKVLEDGEYSFSVKQYYYYAEVLQDDDYDYSDFYEKEGDALRWAKDNFKNATVLIHLKDDEATYGHYVIKKGVMYDVYTKEEIKL